MHNIPLICFDIFFKKGSRLKPAVDHGCFRTAADICPLRQFTLAYVFLDDLLGYFKQLFRTQLCL